MVSLTAVRESNASLHSEDAGKVALFVGATSGLGLATLTEYIRNANQPKAYIVGRNEEKLSGLIADVQAINPGATLVPIASEISLFKHVDMACKRFSDMKERLDLLVMSPGYLKVARLPDNEDGVEETITLRYYVRARFIQNLLPKLNAASFARIVSIHGAGKEGRLNEEDLLLQETYSMQNAATHSSTMNSLALEQIANDNPSISCIHTFPGIVITPAFDKLCEDWWYPLRALFTYVAMPLAKALTMSLPESGERHLFMATSSRYPPKAGKDGAVRPPGVNIATGSNGEEGSGCYLLNAQGDSIGNRALLDEYRDRDGGNWIWDHTREVFAKGAK